MGNAFLPCPCLCLCPIFCLSVFPVPFYPLSSVLCPLLIPETSIKMLDAAESGGYSRPAFSNTLYAGHTAPRRRESGPLGRFPASAPANRFARHSRATGGI